MKNSRNPTRPNGFALVVTLSLMILLTVIAVGLLTLSSVTLRTSAQGTAQANARANARLALMLAIGELQKTAGLDQRITAPANLVNSTAATGIAGVWKSWRPPFTSPDYAAAKTGTNFLGYLMSNPNPTVTPDPAKLPAGTKSQQLVGPGSVGTTDVKSQISAPAVDITAASGKPASGRFSWVALDEGVKGRIDLAPANLPSGQGEAIAQVGAPPRNGIQGVTDLQFLAASSASEIKNLRDSLLPKLISLQQTGLGASKPDMMKPYFHDFTVSSNIVQADVANGGLKTDLSVVFDGAYGDPVPSPYAGRYLYSDSSSPFQGSNSDSQWDLYANYSRLYGLTTSGDNPQAGLTAALPTGYALKKISDPTLGDDRYEPDMSKVKQPVRMPTVLRVDTMFSLVTHPAQTTQPRKPAYQYELDLMFLPVITLHNPYNVPLSFSKLMLEFENIPVGFKFFVKGTGTSGYESATVDSLGLMPLQRLNVKTASNFSASKTFTMTLSNSLTSDTKVLMGPGETKIFGTPFASTATNGDGTFDDYNSGNPNRVTRTIPGMITGPNDGVGYNAVALAPNAPVNYGAYRKDWLKQRYAEPVSHSTVQIILNPTDNIQVQFGPTATAATDNKFRINLSLDGAPAATTQVFYKDDARLGQVMAEGVSPRYPDPRVFPATFPAASAPPISTMDLFVNNATQVKNYGNPVAGEGRPRPFAVFSIGGKTTLESFTKSRPAVDTGLAMQMATCDFKSSASQGTSPLEFSLVPVQNGSAAIQSGGPKGDQAYFFGGHGSTNGTNAATIYEIPKAPLQSIAQLRHANGGSIGSVPYVTYTVGESRAHPAIPATAAFYKPDASKVMLDHSWLANDQLWDRYWFSTLSTLQGTAYPTSVTQKSLATGFFAGTRDLPNGRNSASATAGKDAVAAVTTAGGKQSAAYILTKGGFSVNSTSVSAWVAVLSSLASSDVPLVSGSSEKNPDLTPFLRVRQPKAANAGLAAKDKLWSGYRTLSAAQIQTLATQIVAEIKARGPFLSMAEFVNRRLGSSGPLTNNGAIQAALDQSGINSIMVSTPAAQTITPADVAAYGWQNPGAVTGNTGAGSPGEISQGDVLSAIGSFVSVRSDTFRIRAYGNALDPSGKTMAQAWCEATIQRVPEYIDTSDLPAVTATTPANLAFGRQFKVISFRWLDPSEI